MPEEKFPKEWIVVDHIIQGFLRKCSIGGGSI